MSGFFEQFQVRVVNASAGSGKTYALSKRYVQLLLATSTDTPQSIKHILAITFTNKAATQMKERIIALVKKIALAQLTAKEIVDILGPIGLTVPQASQVAQVVMEDIIRYYHYFNVSTIDSFMNSLLAGCAFKMNLSTRFKIKKNSGEYLLLSLDGLIDAASTDKDVRILFERFITQYLFLENRGNWFPKEDLLQVIKILFRQNNTYQMPLLKFNATDKDIYALKKRFISSVANLLSLLPPGVDKRFSNALKEFSEGHPHGFDVDQLSRYFGRQEIPVKVTAVVSAQCEQTWGDIIATLNQIVLCEAYAVFNPYVDLFQGVMGNLSDIQVKEDILFLEQLNKKAGELFANDLVSVAEVYYRLATRFDHYLIDEFQDTAQAQWGNIKPLVEEALAHGGSLFYVGDKKQAIYGFRGGKSLLFDHLPDELSAYKAGHDTLSTNYRSSRFIVEFNNAVFAQDNLLRMVNELEVQDRCVDKDIVFNLEDRQSLHDVFEASNQVPKDNDPSGHVRVEIIAGKVKEERSSLTKTKVIDAIQDARARFSLKDIAVLTRNNNEVEEITGWLMAYGISARSERTSDIKNHALIKEMMSFLRFLKDMSDNTAFVDLITAEVFLNATGHSKEEMEVFLFEHRPEKRQAQGFLYRKVFKDHFPQVWKDYFEPYVDQVGIYPLYEMVLNICQGLKVLASFPKEQGFIMHWLELIKRQEEQGCDVETFLDYFDALEDADRFVPMPAMEAVQVLTIHKAKGLEYGCVIIPFLEMSIKVGSGDKSGGQSFLWDETEEGLRLFRLKDNYTRFCPLLKSRYAHEFKQSFMSELNTMYVALTRAVHEMVIFIPEKAGNGFNTAMLLVPEAFYVYGQAKARRIVTQEEPLPTMLPPADLKPWVGGWSEELTLISSENMEKRRHGEIIHFCLSRIKNIRGGDLRGVVKNAVISAQAVFKFVHGAKVYEHSISNLLISEDWKPFFDLPLGTEILTEQEIVNSWGDTRRIDRLLVFGDKVCAIDFKPKSDASKYVHQMEEYRQLLKVLYKQHRIESHILTYGY